MTSVPFADLTDLRFASGASAGDGSVQWLLKRNCSLSPRHSLAVYLMLCGVCLGIAAMFWHQGAWVVLPFAGIELLALGLALLVYARHAADRESLVLRQGRLVVECRLGDRSEMAEFTPAWVRIDRRSGDRSLIEVSSQGRSIAIGRFVRPEQRRALADELRRAIQRFSLTDAAVAQPV